MNITEQIAKGVLGLELGDVVLDLAPPAEYKQRSARALEVYLDSALFYAHWLRRYQHDAITYSFNPPPNRAPCHRLIYHLSPLRPPFKFVGEARRLPNVHTKLYFFYYEDNLAVWAGSQNYVAPTLLDVMVQVPPDYNNLCLDYFEKLWKQATPIGGTPLTKPMVPSTDH